MGSTVLSEFYEKNEFVDYTKEQINQKAIINLFNIGGISCSSKVELVTQNDFICSKV